MRIVIAPQSLKGSLSALETAQAIATGALMVYPDADIDLIAMADGGEGTVQALVDATQGNIHTLTVTGPLATPVEAFYGILGDQRTAVIEMAAAAGLPLVPRELRDPRITTTYGVGELITAALDDGCRSFVIGIGGSATNDGGAGMAQALGARLLDAEGRSLSYGGAALAALDRIEISDLDPRLAECTFEVACDVTNPLCGATGATAIYGPQKGATPAMVLELDQALAHYADIIRRDLHKDVRDLAGSGAAGGLGAGLVAFLQAALKPGATIVLETLHVAERICSADLVITAEGQLDGQTAYGKSVGALAQMAQAHSVPVLAIGGGLGENYQALYDLGIQAITVLPDRPMSLEDAMHNAARLTTYATERALRLFKMGSYKNT